jgi:uncharacterized protein
MINLIKKTLMIFFLIYGLIVILLYINQRDMLYHLDKEKYGLEYYNIDNTDEITLISSDNTKLQAWYHKPDNNKKMVIFLHGNSGTLENRVDKLRILSDMGYGFIIPAWRGFGKSEGSPTKEGLYLDAEAAISFVKDQDYNLKDVIIIGESLGTGIATEMSTRYNFKGLLLLTPYTSIGKRASEIYPFMFAEFLVKDNFNVIDKISKINQPLLIIHGNKDTVIPYDHSKRIFAKALERKKLIIYPDVGHNDYDDKTAFKDMQEFFKD